MRLRINERVLEWAYKVNPVRELCYLTVCADGGFKPPSASKGNDRRLKSAAFSNGVNHRIIKSPAFYVTH